MKQEIAKQWVAALRSGQYRQGTGRLRTDNKFCCLGVLCNLHAQAHPGIAATQTDPNRYLNQSEELPTKVMKWAGMRSACGNFHTPRTLATINDWGTSFSELADVIEQNWEKL